MPTFGIRNEIKLSIQDFSKKPFSEAATGLLNTLGYTSEKRLQMSLETVDGFLTEFDKRHIFNREKALTQDWKSIDLLFQITDEEVTNAISNQVSLFESKKVNDTIIQSYLFFTLELEKPQYSRTQLAQITREINKLFPMPAMVIFRHGDTISISIIARRLHKRDESRDVLDKVTLIKDISIRQPHRGHIEILNDLSIDNLAHKFAFTNFVELHRAWQETLDISELNKKFYKEIANWYFWAIKRVTFPEGAGEDVSNRNATSVIRLITRLIFVWFIKEKGLVPDALFDDRTLRELLNYEDPKGSTYYKAILQNLFFATLNTEMGPGRKFRSENEQGRDGHYLIPNVYRYKKYFKDPDKAIGHFSGIPFLNGGLFECLDKEVEQDGNRKVIRIDGFSDRDDNPICVPDELFFGGEQTVDLSEDYGDRRHAADKVCGLINIFNKYKFTIEENTPIEEEIALDPELLGKVFENLLASYNPETGTTARKQTGSFYTPREIVNYMVDEALIAYLETKLAGAENGQERLRHLVAYTNETHAFNAIETNILIDAINEIKVLDPACGSGAFPMGVLHKLVFILRKLDPESHQWQQIQLEKAIKETEEAYKLGNQNERRQRLLDIEDTFNNDKSDFGRKLFLIQNCIFGVDILPIAVQISKLRFFISLIVDQKNEKTKNNLGIRPLPNLESKFVAANTLIGIDKPEQMLIRNPLIDDKEKELIEIRNALFNARTSATKLKYRSIDRRIREEIITLLKNDGWGSISASQMANWDPFDQNSSSEFFDPEWMFGIREGFNIVIGNPPYVSFGLRNAQSMSEGEKAILRTNFPNSAEYKISLYALFIDMAIRLSNNSIGIQTMIVPDSFLLGMYFSKVRKLILRENLIREILWIPTGVFDAVVGFSIVYFFKKSKTPDNNNLMVIKSTTSAEELAQRTFIQYTYSQKYFLDTPLNRFRLFFSEKDKLFIEKIEAQEEIKLGEIAKITTGVRSKVGKDQIISKIKRSSKWKRGIISGGQVTPFLVVWNDDWINIDGKVLFGGGWDANYVEQPKVMIRQTGDHIIAGIDFDNLYHLNNVHTCSPLHDKYDVRLIAAILNSKLMNKYYSLISLEEGRPLAQTDIETLEKLPFPKVDQNQKEEIIDRVNKIIEAFVNDPNADVSDLVNDIDLLVYELFKLTENEIEIVEKGSERKSAIKLGGIIEADKQVTENSLKIEDVHPLPSDYGLYKCSICGKIVMGYDKEKHANEFHRGETNWSKIR